MKLEEDKERLEGAEGRLKEQVRLLKEGNDKLSKENGTLKESNEKLGKETGHRAWKKQCIEWLANELHPALDNAMDRAKLAVNDFDGFAKDTKETLEGARKTEGDLGKVNSPSVCAPACSDRGARAQEAEAFYYDCI